MRPAIGFYQRTPAVRRARAVNAVLMHLSLLAHDAISRNVDGRGLHLDEFAQVLRDLANEVDAVAETVLDDYETNGLAAAA